MKHKVGRPTTTTKVGPPGTKYCKKGEHFPRKEHFKGDDNYCIECRKEYNKMYWEKNNQPPEEAEIWDIEVNASCTCGANLYFPNSGEFECPECGKDWKAQIKARITE